MAKDRIIKSIEEIESTIEHQVDNNLFQQNIYDAKSKCPFASVGGKGINNAFDANEILELYDIQNLPNELQKLVPGVSVGIPNDYNPPVNKIPEWLDMDKFKLGQQFSQRYFVGVNMSQMLSLYILFALPDALETLIFTRNSSTPFTSFKRYLSTILRVTSWYDYDIWDKQSLGYRNLKMVRGMHLNVSKKINSVPPDEVKTQVTLAGTLESPNLWSDTKHLIQEDFQSFELDHLPRVRDKTINPGKVFVNQLDMSVTQFGFMGLMATYPEKFGAASATKEELEGYVHMWRGICYLLGVEDKYNFCDGSFEEVLKRCHLVIENWAKPSFKQVTEEWEHMARCLAEGMTFVIPSEVSFEATLLYMCWVLDVPANSLYDALPTSQKLSFYMLKFIMTSAVRVPGVLPLMNWQSRKYLGKAAALSPEELKQLENKSYEYQRSKVEPKYESWEDGDTGRFALLGLLLLGRLLV